MTYLYRASFPLAPPSLNNLFPSIKGRGRVPSREYGKWRRDVAPFFQVPPRRIEEACAVEIEIGRDESRADIDNLIKPILDMLVHRGVIAGDDRSIVVGVSARYGDVDGCSVMVMKTPRGSLEGAILRVARATNHGTNLNEFLSRRHKHFTRPRFVMYRWFRSHGISFPTIARLFRCDHTSVMHGVHELSAADAEQFSWVREMLDEQFETDDYFRATVTRMATYTKNDRRSLPFGEVRSKVVGVVDAVGLEGRAEHHGASEEV